MVGPALISGAAVMILGVMAPVFAPPEHRTAVVLAVLNCLIIAALILRLLVVSPLRHSLVLAFLPGILLSWPVTTIYFALVFPNATYDTMVDAVLFLVGADRLQIVVLVFIAAYIVPLIPMLSRRVSAETGPNEVAAGEWGAILIGLASISAGWVTALFTLSGPLGFIGKAVQGYFYSFLFVAGFRWHALSRIRKSIVVCGLVICGFMNTLQSGRGLALLPIVMTVLGYLCSPFTSNRSRAVVIASFLGLYPIYLVVGNQGRHVFQSKSYDDFEERVTTITDTLQGDRAVIYERGDLFSDVMSRHFCAGGHAMIVQGWEQRSLGDLPVAEYVRELGRTLLPAFIFGQPKTRRFTGSEVLRDYGFRITDETAVEPSLLGSLYNHGGLAMVLIGGLIIGIAHLLFYRAISRRPVEGLGLMFVSGSVAVSLWAYNNDLIHNIRSQVWMTIYCALVYLFIRFGRFIVTHHWKAAQPPAEALKFRSSRPMTER